MKNVNEYFDLFFGNFKCCFINLRYFCILLYQKFRENYPLL